MLFCVAYGCGMQRTYHLAASIHQAPNRDQQYGTRKAGDLHLRDNIAKEARTEVTTFELSFYPIMIIVMPFTTTDVVTSPQLWCYLLDDDSELEQDLLYNSSLWRKWIIYRISLFDCDLQCLCNNSALLSRAAACRLIRSRRNYCHATILSKYVNNKLKNPMN